MGPAAVFCGADPAAGGIVGVMRFNVCDTLRRNHQKWSRCVHLPAEYPERFQPTRSVEPAARAGAEGFV
jgi:hypothetical protein